jgi:hypothetical protein
VGFVSGWVGRRRRKVYPIVHVVESDAGKAICGAGDVYNSLLAGVAALWEKLRHKKVHE